MISRTMPKLVDSVVVVVVVVMTVVVMTVVVAMMMMLMLLMMMMVMMVNKADRRYFRAPLSDIRLKLSERSSKI